MSTPVWRVARKLREFRDKYRMRKSWHEPDEQEVDAKVVGNTFDNAMGDSLLSDKEREANPYLRQERVVLLYVDGEQKEVVNLASVCSAAAAADDLRELLREAHRLLYGLDKRVTKEHREAYQRLMQQIGGVL